MKFRNLILAVLLVGTLVPNADAMKRPARNTQDCEEPAAKKVNIGALTKTEAVINPWLPQEILVHIFAFCTPFKSANDVLNLMYTCKAWYHTFINQNDGRFNENIADLFFKLHGCSGESYALTAERFGQVSTNTALLHAWALEKCGTSFPLYTSVDEIGTADIFDLPLGKILVSLAKKSFDPNSQNTKTGNTLLHSWCRCCFGEEAKAITRALLKFGANPLICNQDDIVAYKTYDDRDRLLLYITLDPYCKNKTATGKTLLHLILASKYNFICDNIEKLSQLNINPNVPCNQGNTPLHDMIQCTFVGKHSWITGRHGEYVLKNNFANLLKLSANPTIANNAGETPLALAKRLHADPSDEHKLNNWTALEIIAMLEQAAKEAEENVGDIVEIKDETMTDLS